MAGDAGAPPTLANNVETMANVALILANGADWFREYGTAESPGTIVCTITGSTQRSGVGEVPMGTTLREVITEIGGGPEPGVAHPRRAARACRTRSSPTPSSNTPLTLRGDARPPAPASAPAGSSCSTSATTWWPSPRASPASSPSSRAGSARRASRTAWRSPTCCSSSASPTPPRPTPTSWRRASTPSPTRPAATWPPSSSSSSAACWRCSPATWPATSRRRPSGRRP